MTTTADPANPTEPHDHVEPAADMLTQADEGALAALDAALSGTPADPQPGDPLPPPDSEPRAPEGDGASDPADNAPNPDGTKPDDTKTEEPVDPKADDPMVEPATGPEGPAKRPSDEFGDLPADAPAKTRERFETMRTRYDEVTAQRDEAAATAQQWRSTVESTGATPEQFGMTLSYLQAVNSGTVEGRRAAYEMMTREIATLAEALGEELPGIHDPLAAYPDLQQRVEDTDLAREDALELARARTLGKQQQAVAETTTAQSQQQAEVDAGLQAVAAFGASRRSDPAYAARAAAIKPLVERVVANLPPAQWLGAITELYNGVAIAPAPTPVPTVPRATLPVRPTGAPGSGDGLAKQPGSAYEAVEMALGGM